MLFRPFLALLALLTVTCAMAQTDGRPEAATETPAAATLDTTGVHTEAPLEIMPAFPGGDAAMATFIGKTIRYPKQARKKGIEGVVYVYFVVERDGRISNAEVKRGIGGGCDEEALRVVNAMPPWQPGQQGGKTVRTSYQLPLRFKLVD